MYQIRRATKEDAGLILGVHRASIVGEAGKYYDDAIIEEWQADLSEKKYIDNMKKGETFFIAVRESDGLCLGFIGVRDDQNVVKACRTAIYVHSEVIGQGIGRALFQQAEDFIATEKQDIESIRVDSSVGARHFYEARGFGYEEPKEGEHVTNSGQKMRCFYMKKMLKNNDGSQPLLG